MKIIFSNVNLRYRHIIKRIFDEAEEFTNNKVDNSYISLAFVSEDEIRDLNSSFRKLDKETDVLSFPMLDIKQGESTLADFESEREPDGRLNIGDIAICLDVAKRQAKNLGHSLKREVCFLALHGLLHVLGFDHIESQDEEIMQKTAEEILNKLNIRRK